MSSLTHLRRQRKERGCHWDNTRRNKVMFRGKHSLGTVLYLCSLTQFLFLLFLFLLFRHISSLFFASVVCLCFVCLMNPSLFCAPCFFFASPVVIFIFEKAKAQTVSCPGSDCCRLVRYSMCSVRAGVLLKCFLLGWEGVFSSPFLQLEGC